MKKPLNEAFCDSIVAGFGHQLNVFLFVRAALLACAVVFTLVTEGQPSGYSGWIPIVVLITWVILSSWRQFRQVSCSQTESMVVLAIDLVLLAWMICQFGGVANPVISALLIPVLIAAVLLKPLQLASIIALSIVVYGVAFASVVNVYDEHMRSHLAGMGWVFAATVATVCPLLSYLVHQLATQVEQVSQLQRQKLRDQQIMAVAGLAAVTLHELSTPLSTMQMCVEIMEASGDRNQHIPVLQAQLDRCRDTLKQLRKEASIETDALDTVPVDQWIDSLLKTTFHLMPHQAVDWQLDLPIAQKPIQVCPSVTTACLNLLLNAIKACSGSISLRWKAGCDRWSLSIAHQCVDLDPEFIQSLGRTFIKSAGGMGLGTAVSSWTVEQKGGAITYKSLPGGGIETSVHMPWNIE